MKSSKDLAEEAVEIFTSKATLPIRKILILAFLSGIFIGLSSLLSFAVSFDSTKGFERLLAGSAFSIGFILIVLTNSELFTANTLMIMPLLKGEIRRKQMLVSWIIVYFGNFLGALFFSFLIFYSGIGNAIKGHVVESAMNQLSLGYFQTFLRAFACNLLVAFAILLSIAGTNLWEKILGVFFPVMAFATLNFEHSITNMFSIPLAILENPEAVGITSFLLKNLLPVTIGNILGGIFIGFIYWYLYLKEEIII